MRNKRLLTIFGIAIVATIVLFIVGVNTRLFQSSLIETKTYSGTAIFDLSEGKYPEFRLDDLETKAYRGLLGIDSGLSFSNVYDISSGEKGGILIGFKGNFPLTIEKKLTFEIEYPQRFLQYLGQKIVNFKEGTIEVKDNPVASTVTVYFQPNSPYTINTDVPDLFFIPFEITPSDLNQGDLYKFKMTSAIMTDKNDKEVPVKFYQDIVNLFIVKDQVETSSVNTGTALTDRNTFTMPIRKPFSGEVGSTQSGNVVNNVSTGASLTVTQITNDKTQILPREIKEKTGEIIYLYVSVINPNGANDFAKVYVDLSQVGLEKEKLLNPLENQSDLYIFGNSFILPDTVIGRTDPYILPIVVVDKSNKEYKGELQLIVKPNENVKPVVSNKVETDVNHDGKVDILDLTMFLDAYKEATK